MADILILDMGTIKGNCTINGYADKIIVESYVPTSVTMPMQMDLANSERTMGRPSFSDYYFTKLTDIATPVLFQFSTLGTPIPKVVFYRGRMEGATGDFMEQEKHTLTDVFIVNFQPGQGMESFSLNFNSVQLEVKQQLKTGALKGTSAFTFDQSTAKKG